MADLSYPTALRPLPGWVQGRVPARYSGTLNEGVPTVGGRDFRHLRATSATISDQVVLKTGAGELPFVNGRIWLLRKADGFKAWEGFSDASGNYTATGLEVGVEYIAVAIDPFGNQKATGAGPVTAA